METFFTIALSFSAGTTFALWFIREELKGLRVRELVSLLLVGEGE